MSDEKIIVYGTPTCPMVSPVRGLLNRAQAAHDYIDISQDFAGKSHVREINNGYESVPTLVFPDGSTLTEPSSRTLTAKLVELGYDVKRPSLWQSFTENPWFSFAALALLLFGLVDQNYVFGIIGGGLLLFVFVQSRL